MAVITEKTKKTLLFLLLFSALILRLYYLPELEKHTFFYVDEVRYYRTAIQFMQKGFIGFNSSTPNSFITPGFILFMAGVFTAADRLLGSGINYVHVLSVTQAFLSVAILLFIYLLARQIAGEKTAFLALLLSIAYPPFISANAKVMTEVLSTFFFIIYLYLAAKYTPSPRWKGHFAAGTFLALTVLVRPTPAPLLFVPYLLAALPFPLRQRNFLKHWLAAVNWKGLLLCFLAFSLVMLPWWVRNYNIYHRFVPFSTEGPDPFLRGMDPYDPVGNQGERVIRGVPPEKQFERALELFKEGVKRDPALWLKWFTIGKTQFLWARPWGYVPFWKFSFSKYYHQIVVLLLGWSGLFLSLQDRRFWWPASVPIYFTLIHLLFLPVRRYAFPVIPVMFIFAAWLIVKAGQKTAVAVSTLLSRDLREPPGRKGPPPDATG
ncbi:MAG: hypothetical protein PWQ91_677 [Eubacteriales bacterium]|nr:hypothetical protein [Eubacteriales bacterium]